MTVNNYSSRKKEEKTWWEETKEKAKLWTATGLIFATIGACGAGIYREIDKGNVEFKNPLKEETQVVKQSGTPLPLEENQNIYAEIKDGITNILSPAKSYEETVEDMVPEMEHDDIRQFTEEIEKVYSKVEENGGVQNSINGIIRDFDTLIDNSKDKNKLKALIGVRMIESSGRLDAVSSTGNTGIYQLGKSTAQSYGLEISGKEDERYNIEKATSAASQYLDDLHNRFGQWDLAILSYHQGESNVGNMVADYIEKHHGEEYQLGEIWSDEVERYNVDLPDILEDEEIVDKYMDPDYSLSGRNYVQKVFAAVDIFEKRLEEEKSFEVTKYQKHSVEPGDYLIKIAKETGTTSENIIIHNPDIMEPDDIRPGMELNIPSTTETKESYNIKKKYYDL